MRGMAHAGFCPPPRSLSNQRASWIAPRARTHAHTFTQAPCVDNAREFRHSVPASPTIRMLVCMPCGGNNSGWRVRATGQWPGLVRLPRGGVGRGPGRANDAPSQLRIGSSMQPRPRAAGKSRGCDEPRPPIGHAKRSVVARVRGRAGSSPARVPLRGWGASRQLARNRFGGRLACLEVPSWVMPRA